MRKHSGWLLVCAFLVALPAHAQEGPPPWDRETVRLFATLPIQDGGRVKPVDTFASFKLLQINGRRKCRIGDSNLFFPLNRMVYPHRSPMEWFLDGLFYPERARQYPSFLVENSDALVALGSNAVTQKRGRYSYAELEPVRDRLFERAGIYAGKPAKERDAVQREILRLAENLHAFEQVTDALAFARHPIAIEESQTLSSLFPGQTSLPLSAVLAQAPAIQRRFIEIRSGGEEFDEAARTRELDALRNLLTQLDHVRSMSEALALFPPSDADQPWQTVADVITNAFDPSVETGDLLAWLGQLEAMSAARDNRAQFEPLLTQFHASVTERARALGEYGTIELEVVFYRAKLFYRSLVLYIMCFVLIALSWLRPRSRAINTIAPIALTIPTLLLIAGITMRCIIRARPPVTTLYETILFVTAVAVTLALCAEYVSRQRIALAVGSILGVFGMLLANKYEAANAEDTMPSMIAVLDTNFWLTAHVTTIVVGYAASLLSGALAHIYVFAKAFGIKRGDAAFYRTMTRMVYGILCFGFFFTFMGTVLGGIWANESWGRFWGWDPKENGALLIVLWQLALLHARLGGYIRDLGVNLGAVFGAAIVAFSWWGVNLLGVGLHTYGFTHGTMNALLVYWGFEALVLLLGASLWTRERGTVTDR